MKLRSMIFLITTITMSSVVSAGEFIDLSGKYNITEAKNSAPDYGVSYFDTTLNGVDYYGEDTGYHVVSKLAGQPSIEFATVPVLPAGTYDFGMALYTNTPGQVALCTWDTITYDFECVERRLPLEHNWALHYFNDIALNGSQSVHIYWHNDTSWDGITSRPIQATERATLYIADSLPVSAKPQDSTPVDTPAPSSSIKQDLPRPIKTDLNGGGSIDCFFLSLLLIFGVSKMASRYQMNDRVRTAGLGSGLLFLLLSAVAPHTLLASDLFVDTGVGYSRISPDAAASDYEDGAQSNFAGQIGIGIRKGYFAARAYRADAGSWDTSDGSLDYSVYGAEFRAFLGKRTRHGWQVYGSAGVANMDVDGNIPYMEANSSQITFGAGITYDYGCHVQADLGTQSIDKDLFLISATVRFGTGPDSCGKVKQPDVQPATKTPEPIAELQQRVRSYHLQPRTGFAYDSAELSSQGLQLLNDLAAILHYSKWDTLYVDSYASSEGSEEYNMALSQRRAQSVEDALVDLGVANNGDIVIRAHGEQDPVCTEDTSEECLSQNRRVTFDVTVESGGQEELRI